jgi:hypothetical protein
MSGGGWMGVEWSGVEWRDLVAGLGWWMVDGLVSLYVDGGGIWSCRFGVWLVESYGRDRLIGVDKT